MEIDSEKEKEEKKETLSLVHYNALPPNGPKFSSVFISHSGSVEAAPEKASDGNILFKFIDFLFPRVFFFFYLWRL